MTNDQRVALIDSYDARRKFFDQKRNGTLSESGEEAALEFLLGIVKGMTMMGATDADVPTYVAFLASVRGADEAIDGQRKIVEEQS